MVLYCLAGYCTVLHSLTHSNGFYQLTSSFFQLFLICLNILKFLNVLNILNFINKWLQAAWLQRFSYLLTNSPTFTIARHSRWIGSSSRFGGFDPTETLLRRVGPKGCTIGWKTEFGASVLVFHPGRSRYVISPVVHSFLYDAAYVSTHFSNI